MKASNLFQRTLLIIGLVIPVSLLANGGDIIPPANAAPASPVCEEGVDPSMAPCIVDAQGRKQGMWIHWGSERPGSGYLPDCRIEEGVYKDNRKEGEWIKYHTECNKVRLVGNYVDGRPQGHYRKTDLEGKVEEGDFVKGHQVGDFVIVSPTGVKLVEKTFDEDGKANGKIIERYPSGQIMFEAERRHGVPTGREIHYYENGDVKKVISYKEDGSVESVEEKERVNPVENIKVDVVVSTPAPDGRKGNTNGKPFDPNSYNKVYNDNQELWMDGKFKDGKLWDGKLYQYDADGILLKIEIWKEGRYNSDGVLR